MKRWRAFLQTIVLSLALTAYGEAFEQLPQIALALSKVKKAIQQQAETVNRFAFDTNEEEYLVSLAHMKSLKKEKIELEEAWKQLHTENNQEEESAPWDAGEVTLAQFVVEYGPSDCLYVVPPEISAMKIHLFSAIPLPRDSWGEMLEMILAHNGIGIKKINAWAKQLYILKLDPSAIEGIATKEEELQFFDPQARIAFLFSPKIEQLRAIQNFFERFSDAKQTTIQTVASKIILVASRDTIDKLVGLYRTVWDKERGKLAQLVNLTKISSVEAEKVLKAVFGDSAGKSRPPFLPNSGEELATLVLPQGLVLVGESEIVQRGIKILSDLEQQLEDPLEKVVYWYSCRHSNPEDIAAVLERVYDSLIGVALEKKEPPAAPSPLPPVPPQEPNPNQVFPFPSTAYNPVLPVSPAFIQPGTIDNKPKSSFGNFVVDPKTAAILMVVRRDELPKIKSLIKKLDVPKRMVQLDVLLVEKKLTDQKQIGINLLNFGSHIKAEQQTNLIFNTGFGPEKGLFKFLFVRPNSGNFPGIDLRYNFLLAQHDIRINANPTLLAINQTPATISVVEEISINNGAIQLDTTTGVTIEKSFTRAQYGTTIVMTPTIHMSTEEECPSQGFVSLQTDVTFDTTECSVHDDRPPVTRRHIVNEVQIADGETVILGGLRRKAEEDQREKIPFLGDLPGIGKLFGSTKMTDTNTEMFIFITPRIIHDPVEDLRKIRQDEYRKRPGDIPEFLKCVDEARAKERKRLFDNSLKMLFDGV